MKYKKIAIISIIVLAVGFILLALSNSTFALFSSDDYAKRPDSYSTGLLQIKIESKTENISLTNALPMEDSEGIQLEPYVFTIRNTGNLDYQCDVKLLSIGVAETSFSSQYIRLQIDDGEVTSLSNLTNGIIKSGIILKAGESIDVSIRIWLSIDTPNTELGKSFNSKIVTDGQAIYTESNYNVTTFADYITNLYIGDAKENVTNNDIIYGYGTSTNLMSDKLGGTLGYDGGNIRYYGASPDNYVYFNCDDYENPTSDTCELWRIVGVFDGKVKLVRDATLGDFAWHYDSEGNGGNDWTTSTLNEILNNGYYNNLDGVTHYSNDGSSIIAKTVNFSTSGKGLTDATRNNDFIYKSTWYINGMSTGSYAHELYNNERTGENNWTGNIALMYPSDYAYAVDFRECDKDVYGYNDTNCYDNNWINIMNHAIGNNSALLITHNPTNSMKIWRIAYTGAINIDGNSNNRWRVHPTLYLEDDIIRISGSGTSSDPYVIGLNNYINDRGLVIDYIIDLYSSNNPIQITQYKSDGTTEQAKYYYSSSVNLMNDGLGATVTDTTALTSGTEGNIRYYGSDPNNYIYFNCTDYNNQSSSTCEKWRIIGIVDGKVKIVRDQLLGYSEQEDSVWSFSWDFTSTGEYDNNWHDSTLMTILNDGYYNNMNGINNYYLFWPLESEDYQINTSTYNFNNSGLGIKNKITQDIISESIWYLGGHNSSSIYPNQIYGYERGDAKCSTCTYDTIWTGKIGLMYPSDYGYAVDLSTCNKTLYGYSSCSNANWMNPDGGYAQWLLTPSSNNNEDVFRMQGELWGNYLFLDSTVKYIDQIFVEADGNVWFYGVYPTLYLDPNLIMSINGDGTSANPYQLLVY